ncbi:hypothetical protein [Bacillus phage vB_BceS-M2]
MHKTLIRAYNKSTLLGLVQFHFPFHFSWGNPLTTVRGFFYVFRRFLNTKKYHLTRDKVAFTFRLLGVYKGIEGDKPSM